MSSLQNIVSTQLLPYVNQPGQYIGREINQLVADGDWEDSQVRVAIAFPDAYTIGMSHLGCQILYWLTNHTPGCCAERVFCPWLDAEKRMRKQNIPLFTWDTRQPVASADILAISLQYEMTFTSVLQLLDLASIPFRAAQRDDCHPLVIGGGPQADNPEPMAEFFDLIVLGDGEESMAAILEAYKEMKASGVRRRDMIVEMAKRFEWIYAPSLYNVTYQDDGTIASILPRDTTIPSAIHRCKTLDFENAPFPLNPVVPFVDAVHDRFAVEIMRGCPQRCRFCHAGYTKRPLGVRSVNQILSMAEEMYTSTGMSELGLLSLSTADYPDLRELMERANEQFTPRRVNISVPSLRVDAMLQHIPSMANAVRKGGLTMAVEAASDDLRAAIRKLVTDGNLIDGVKEAYAAGWRRVKLYFMCGFPGERTTDIEEIVHLSKRVSEARREVKGGPADVSASVGWLVPKPYTPFQWAAQPEAAYFHEARMRLNSTLRNMPSKKGKHGVRIKTHSVERSVLEAVFARGDRRLSESIVRAYELGARFDGWDECFDHRIWDKAFDDTNIDPAFYAHRERSEQEIFPWTHLQGGAPNEYLQRQYNDVFTHIGVNKPAPGILQPA